MITFVLSQYPDFWRLNRFSNNVSEIASGIPTEEQALALAIEKAKEECPSQVLRIAINGDSRVVAKFD
jgi:hypothetical protein